MKQIFTLLLLSTLLTADLITIEAGAGSWSQTPLGFMEYKDTDKDNSGRDTSNENEFTNMYVWGYIEHFLPYIPNFRVEYSSLESDGQGSGTLSGFEIPIGSNFPTTLTFDQLEVIPYYNLLDDTFWITLDMGIAIKFVDYQATGRLEANVGGLIQLGDEIYNEAGNFIAPLPYIKIRGQIPFTTIGLETTIKYGAIDNSSFIDTMIKIDYVIDFLPIIHPGIELGYKYVDIDAEVVDGDTTSTIKLEFSGLFGGLMFHF